MADRFVIDMLPAREGDCLWIEYGPEDNPHRILIDGGRQSAYDALSLRFAALPAMQREFELLVCTHVDADHIEGLLKLVDDPALAVSFKDVWFNGYDHLHRPDGTERYGARQGERLSSGILRRRWTWNGAFSGRSVVVPDTGDLPCAKLAGGMILTLLSPTWDGLGKMEPVWRRECERHGLVPGVEAEEELPLGIERFGALNAARVEELARSRFKADQSKANATSIAFIASYKGHSILLTGDAHVDVINAGLDRYAQEKPIRFDAIKLSHHGSQGTLSKEFVARVSCGTFLISTDGSRHGHPDREAIARLVTTQTSSARLAGNYRSRGLLEWDIAALRQRFNYEIVVPNVSGDGSLRTELFPSGE